MDLAEEQGTLTQEWTRAHGENLCNHCDGSFWAHPMGGIKGIDDRQFLHRLCDGRLVKL